MERANECTVANTIKERRSIKKFKEDPVSQQLIIDLLNVAVWAPDHKVREPWRFILFIGEGKQKLIDAVYEELSNGNSKKNPEQVKEYMEKVPAHLLVLMKEDPRPLVREEDFAATSTMIQNFQLAAWERELGVIWKTSPFIYSPTFHQAVGVKPGEKLVGLLQIGYPDAIPKAVERTSAEAKLTIIAE